MFNIDKLSNIFSLGFKSTFVGAFRFLPTIYSIATEFEEDSAIYTIQMNPEDGET